MKSTLKAKQMTIRLTKTYKPSFLSSRQEHQINMDIILGMGIALKLNSNLPEVNSL